MKYFFISLLVTIVIGIISYLLGITNNKSDRIFLTLFGGMLLIIGGYFSFRYEKIKDEDSFKKSKKLDTTITNTEKLKAKADSIIFNLNQSIERTLILSDSINRQNITLGNIENNIKNQVTSLEKTLKQTKIFEEKVREQLENS